MFGFRRRRVKPSNAALFLAIVMAIGLEGEFLQLVWLDVAAKGVKAVAADHLFAIAVGFVLWGALPCILLLISRELKKQGK